LELLTKAMLPIRENEAIELVYQYKQAYVMPGYKSAVMNLAEDENRVFVVIVSTVHP